MRDNDSYRSFRSILAAAVLLAVCTGSTRAGTPGKIATDLLNTKSNGPLDVIIQFTERPVTGHHNLVVAHGGRLKRDLSRAIQGAHYSIPRPAIEGLSRNPKIRFITPVRAVKALLDAAVPTVGGDIARSYGWTGKGVGVAVIDSGVGNHGDLRNADGTSRVVYSESLISGNSNTNDSFGHGTHVAGIVAGNARLSTGASYFKSFRGMAPQAHIVNLRVLNSEGSGSDASVIAAIDRAIELRDVYGIRVINLSLGRPVRESYKVDPLCQAVESAWRAGIVVVVAAGNEGRNSTFGTQGYGTIMSPANDPLVVTVGAANDRGTESRADDVMATYSSKGPSQIDHIVKPDLVAPGNQVISLVALNSMTKNKSDSSNLIPYTYYQNTARTDFSSEY